ncbi:MAG: prepilin-type N-terminal cleavage/methylation domain-containing protein [Piscirickettsiaceae bacterium]|nr:prepilin-type N-terminal cleavage/methylation domain-containing protein [Piscirickettsiaceae bacterium]
MVFPIISGKLKGFTFVEVMVVMAIVALLLTIALPRYFSGLERAKEAILHQDLMTMRDAIDHYHSDKGIYPESLESLVEQKYLRAMPVDPITEQDDTWLIVPLADYSIGVYDIRSGAEGTASDGTEYIDW